MLQCKFGTKHEFCFLALPLFRFVVGVSGAVHPQGATVVDFAYHVHTDVGNQMFGAKINGKAVHAGHALANAEVVEVLTYDGRPSRSSLKRHQVRFLLAINASCAGCLWDQNRCDASTGMLLVTAMACCIRIQVQRF